MIRYLNSNNEDLIRCEITLNNSIDLNMDYNKRDNTCIASIVESRLQTEVIFKPRIPNDMILMKREAMNYILEKISGIQDELGYVYANIQHEQERK